MRFSQGAYYSAIHGTIAVLNDMLEDPVESRKTVFIKYLLFFQRETDIDLFALKFDEIGRKLQETDAEGMRKTAAYRITGG